eukprot:3390128-Lingulodinium_polyedra.AAC.1
MRLRDGAFEVLVAIVERCACRASASSRACAVRELRLRRVRRARARNVQHWRVAARVRLRVFARALRL